jgi:hypothetical protein
MRLYSDRPDIAVPGSWHFAPEGAKFLPFATSFGSSRWDDYRIRDDFPLGELRRTGRYSKGKSDPRFLGDHFCGSASAWLNGIPYASRPGLVLGPEGIPICCLPAGQQRTPIVAEIGLEAVLTFAAVFTGDMAADGLAAAGQIHVGDSLADGLAAAGQIHVGDIAADGLAAAGQIELGGLWADGLAESEGTIIADVAGDGLVAGGPAVTGDVAGDGLVAGGPAVTGDVAGDGLVAGGPAVTGDVAGDGLVAGGPAVTGDVAGDGLVAGGPAVTGDVSTEGVIGAKGAPFLRGPWDLFFDER